MGTMLKNIGIPYDITQVMPNQQGDLLFAIGVKKKKPINQIEIPPSDMFKRLTNDTTTLPRSKFICIDVKNESTNYAVTLEHKGEFEMFEQDDKGQVVVLGKTTDTKGRPCNCLSKLSVLRGDELLRSNIGKGDVNSLVYNNNKWYVSGYLDNKYSIYRLSNELNLELVENSKILTDAPSLFCLGKGYLYMVCEDKIYALDEQMKVVSMLQLSSEIIQGRMMTSNKYLYLMMFDNTLQKIKYENNKWHHTNTNVSGDLLHLSVSNTNVNILTEESFLIYDRNLNLKNEIKTIKNNLKPQFEMSKSNIAFLFNLGSNIISLHDNLSQTSELSFPISTTLDRQENPVSSIKGTQLLDRILDANNNTYVHLPKASNDPVIPHLIPKLRDSSYTLSNRETLNNATHALNQINPRKETTSQNISNHLDSDMNNPTYNNNNVNNSTNNNNNMNNPTDTNNNMNNLITRNNNRKHSYNN